jgi:ferrous iron transport protein B
MQNLLTHAQPRTQPASCHSAPQEVLHDMPLVVIVGSPNVGKSVLFNRLTGAYVTVSNYPGTTVEVTRGKARLGGQETGVMDTPGMYSLLPITEEEQVARKILLDEHPAVVVHVVDAKNLERMLPMTLQLIEAGQPVLLAVNLMDEAERLGIFIDIDRLQQRLGIPVIGTALANGRGAKEIRALIQAKISVDLESSKLPVQLIQYPPAIEQALNDISMLLEHDYELSTRAMAALLLQGDSEVTKSVQAWEGARESQIVQTIQIAQARCSQPLPFLIARAQRQAAQRIIEEVFHPDQAPHPGFASDVNIRARLSDAMIHPLTGIPILLLALFLLYEFVGVLGAQIIVNWLEINLFNARLNPWVDQMLINWVPWPALRSLIGGDFGVVTLGLRYAFAIILPIVGTFFIAFSIIEDSGYLPRLAMLIDRVFKRIGLNGRAVIPMVLGFGCDTMATLTTRTLETRRERVISTLLLSLAIPCSAQMGVMLALLAGAPLLLPAWLLIVSGVFLLVGFLSAKLMPGEQPSFYMELPPLRLPRARNVLVKTYTRMEWYLREVFPLFIFASVVIWIGTLTGLFDMAVTMLLPFVRWLGLPDQTAVAFLFGFFRRDYGAAGLYDLKDTMNAAQLLVAVVTMTLFVPCLAQFAVVIKERGWKTAFAMAAFIFPFALLVGLALSSALRLFGFQL